MIDICLRKPYFVWNEKEEIMGNSVTSNWHNENKGVLLINNQHREFNQNDEEIKEGSEKNESDSDDDYENEEDLEKELERQLFLEKKNQRNDIKTVSKNSMGMEIDFDTFKTSFFPTISHRFSLVTDIQAWTEIYSVIKGSALSYLNMGGYLSLKQYLEMANSSLNEQEKTQVFDIFGFYERWKRSMSYYDLMDLVNHQLVQISKYGYNGTPIHYLMVDEVQDLPHNILLLLKFLTEQKLYFAGDTAQSISKGVCGRFCDLVNVFKVKNLVHDDMKPPVVKQLTKNFRSHARILNLANSVISIIEILFPETIDKMKKEKSDLDGPKPIILKDNNLEKLFYLLTGNSEIVSQVPIEFGCSQVIIVRDQASKEKVPNIFKHALCLTIYESKGLEFDDVILFNFFSDAGFNSMNWKIISNLSIKNEVFTKDEFNLMISRHKNLENDEKEDYSVFNAKENSEGNVLCEKLIWDKMLNSVPLSIERTKYMILCNELKMLYTAITRPKKRLIIFDQNIEPRKEIESIWTKLDLVHFLNESNFDNYEKLIGKVLVSDDPEKWRAQGIKMFRNKFYEQALKCFLKSGDQDMVERSKAYHIADVATKGLAECDAKRQELAFRKKKISGEIKTQLKREEFKNNSLLVEAAVIFERLQLMKKAAQCYFSAMDFEKAKNLFKDLGLWIQAGEAAFLSENYEEASQYFEMGKDYTGLMNSLENMKDYEKLLDKLYETRENFDEETRIDMIKKFFPLVLEKCSKKVEMEVKEKENEIKEEAEQEEESDDELPTANICLRKYRSKEMEMLLDLEVDEDEEKESNEIPEEEIKQDKEEGIENEKETTKEQIQKQSDDFSVIKGTESKDSQEENKMESSFSVLQPTNPKGFENSFSVVGEKSKESKEKPIEDSYEHLMNIDLSSEFLVEDSKSIVESISSIRQGNSKSLSEFSALEYAQMIDPSIKVLKTRNNIFIEDQVMIKIIKYINYFENELKLFQTRFRSKNALLQFANEIALKKEGSQNIQDLFDNFEIFVDFDSISIDMLNLILDTLESFNMFKLCIFVCNRYNITERLGRYLVSLGHKFSSIALNDSHLNAQNIFDPIYKKLNQERAYIASLGIHNVLENINENYLKFIPFGDPTRNFGIQTYKGLLALGYWKNCLYIMDAENSLHLAAAMSQYKPYSLLLKASKVTEKNKNEYFDILKLLDFENYILNPGKLFEEPENIILSKELSVLLIATSENKELKDRTDEYLNSLEINKMDDNQYSRYISITKLRSSIQNIKHKLDNNTFEIEDFDDMFYLFTILIKFKKFGELKSFLLTLDVQDFFSFITLIHVVQDYMKSQNKFTQNLWNCILLNYRAKLIAVCPLFNHFGESFVLIDKDSELTSFYKDLYPIDSEYSAFFLNGNTVFIEIIDQMNDSLNYIFLEKMKKVKDQNQNLEILASALYCLMNKSQKAKKHTFSLPSKTLNSKKVVTTSNIPKKANLIAYQNIDHYIEEQNDESIKAQEGSKIKYSNLEEFIYSKILRNKMENHKFTNYQDCKFFILEYSLKQLKQNIKLSIDDLIVYLVETFIVLKEFYLYDCFMEIFDKIANKFNSKDNHLFNRDLFLDLAFYDIYLKNGLISESAECLFNFLDSNVNTCLTLQQKLFFFDEFVSKYLFSLDLPQVYLNNSQLTKFANEKVPKNYYDDTLFPDILFFINEFLHSFMNELNIPTLSENIKHRNYFKLFSIIFEVFTIDLKNLTSYEECKPYILKIIESVENLNEIKMERSEINVTKFDFCFSLNSQNITLKNIESIGKFRGLINEASSFNLIYHDTEFNFVRKYEEFSKNTNLISIVDSEAEANRLFEIFEKKMNSRLKSGKLIYQSIVKRKAQIIKNFVSFNPSIQTNIIISRNLQIKDKTQENCIISNFYPYLKYFDSAEVLRNEILNVYFNKAISFSIDFQFLMLQLDRINNLNSEIFKSLKHFIESQTFLNKLKVFKLLEHSLNELNSLRDSFSNWNQSLVSKTNKADYKKNKQFLAKMLVKKGMISKAMKIAQKLAGYKKQNYLKERKEIRKLIGKK